MSDPQMTVLMLLGEATLILAAGLAASFCFRARPAAAHAVLLTSLLAILVLPAATLLAARAGWGLLPPSQAHSGPASVVVPSAPPRAHFAAQPLGADSMRSPSPPSIAEPRADDAELAAPAPARSGDEPIATSTSAHLQSSDSWLPSRASSYLTAALAWGALSLVAIARLISGIIAGVRLRRASRPVEHRAASGALRCAAQDLGVTDEVTLRSCAGVACPVISCWGRPRFIILPDAAQRDDLDWRAVMAHELAHLRRRDHLTALLAEMIVCILPWHPLSWLARRRLATLAERACDDWALGSAASSTSYADSLVAFVPARRSALLTPAIVSRSGLAARIGRILSDRRAPARVGRGVAFAAALLALSGVAIASLARPRAPLPAQPKPAQPEPAKPATTQPDPAPNSTNKNAQPRKSRPTPSPAQVDAQIAAFLDYWRQNIDKPRRHLLSDLAGKLGETEDPRVIPHMIGVVDAGELDAVYDVGYFGLGYITGVKYSPYHDGAWWRRWWEANKAKFPAAAAIPIPDLPQTAAGKTHVDYPASMDTLEGKIEQLLKLLRDDDFHNTKLKHIVEDLLEHKDPRAIPTLIGVIDADNSADTIYGVGSSLSRFVGVKPNPYHDGAWWRRWWDANKAKFPTAADIPIPDLPKTRNGLAHVPYPESLETVDGQIEWLLKEFREKKTGNLTRIAQQIAEHNEPRTIPPMIGVIAADNSSDTIYGVGHFGLARITGVSYSPYHDGAWWRGWWDANKAKFPTAASIPIPDLPKTPAALAHTDFPASMETFDGKVEWLLKLFRDGDISNMKLKDIADELSDLKDPRAIPTMIGVIDADNSYDTVYAVGYFGLGGLTDVKYSPYHDGAWWRRWWDANKAKYPTAAGIPISALPPTAHAKTYTPMPASFDTFEGQLAWLPEALRSGANFELRDYIEAIASHEDARAIPTLIALMEADPSEDTIYTAGYYGVCKFGDVRWDAQDAAWWRRWWEENKAKYPTAAGIPIPDFKELMTAWKGGEEKREQARNEAQFAGFPSKDLRVDGDERKRYFLLGPADNQKAPENGWRLLLILPGGGGGADFHDFCRTIARDALPEGFVAAQLVAPVWSDNPNRTVWPTRVMNNDKAEFTTEDFIRAVVKDVSKQVKIDPKHVLALGWSSSGPPLYCDSLQADTPITGWFIAMSVFRPQWMPDLAAAKGKSYFLFHSPDETMIPIDKHAKVAETKLSEAGARVKLVEYPGGHGWTDDPMGNIRRGVEWLESSKP